MTTHKSSELAKARRRIAEKKLQTKVALEKFRDAQASKGIPVFASVRRAA